jgi:hypothetical protein
MKCNAYLDNAGPTIALTTHGFAGAATIPALFPHAALRPLSPSPVLAPHPPGVVFRSRFEHIVPTDLHDSRRSGKFGLVVESALIRRFADVQERQPQRLARDLRNSGVANRPRTSFRD